MGSEAAALVVGGSDSQGLCHVTPLGYGESWKGAGGSGGRGGPGPGSGGHRRARAMVRARGTRASSAAGTAAMLGTAVFRAAPRGPVHKSQAGQQHARSGRGEKRQCSEKGHQAPCLRGGGCLPRALLRDPAPWASSSPPGNAGKDSSCQG